MNSTTETREPNIVLKFSNSAVKRPCALCRDAPYRSELGLDTFLAGTWDWVCGECVEKHAAGLTKHVGAMQPNCAVELTKQDIDNASCFGGCPKCGRGYFAHTNRKDHWFYCPEHLVKWFTGSGILSPPDDAGEDYYAKNRQMLSEMETTEAWHPERAIDVLTDIASPHPALNANNEAFSQVYRHVEHKMEESGGNYLSLMRYMAGGDVDTARDAFLLWSWLLKQLEDKFFGRPPETATWEELDKRSD